MDVPGSPSSDPHAAVVILALLQTGCTNPEYQKELRSLSTELMANWDIHGFGAPHDGELESDGHLCCSSRGGVDDIQPVAELHWPGNRDNAEALQGVAAELRVIADQLDRDVVNRSAQQLIRDLESPVNLWRGHLSREVEWALSHGVGAGLEHLPRERVLVALTLTLVKGVCERAPRLLRRLFRAALQYISPVMAR